MPPGDPAYVGDDDYERDPRIVGVALSREGLICSLPAPKRHSDVMSEMRLLGINPTEWAQGFVSSTGEFLTRWEARQIAKRNGQCANPRSRDELFSEDLW